MKASNQEPSNKQHRQLVTVPACDPQAPSGDVHAELRIGQEGDEEEPVLVVETHVLHGCCRMVRNDWETSRRVTSE